MGDYRLRRFCALCGMPERRTHDDVRHGITSLLTPTGSSWINQAVSRSRLLTDQMIRWGACTRASRSSKPASASGFGNWNRNPRPSTWTKTADRQGERAAAVTVGR